MLAVKLHLIAWCLHNSRGKPVEDNHLRASSNCMTIIERWLLYRARLQFFSVICGQGGWLHVSERSLPNIVTVLIDRFH